MFEDIPPRLAAMMRNLPPEMRADKEFFRICAAMLVFREYVGHSPISSPKKQSIYSRPGSKVDSRETSSVYRVGQHLFLLRNTSGFTEICRRLRSRDVQTAAQELHTAELFWSAGYDITVKPESGQAGQDFDFSATRGATVINVEVTALQPTAFSGKKLSNTFSHKRQQIPDDRPAVICCVIPEEWLKVPDIQNELKSAAYRALGASRRLNAIVYIMDVVRQIPDTDTHLSTSISTTYLNRNPRLKFNASFLDDAKNAYGSVSETEYFSVPTKFRPPNEFEKWIEFCWQRPS